MSYTKTKHVLWCIHKELLHPTATGFLQKIHSCQRKKQQRQQVKNHEWKKLWLIDEVPVAQRHYISKRIEKRQRLPNSKGELVPISCHTVLFLQFQFNEFIQRNFGGHSSRQTISHSLLVQNKPFLYCRLRLRIMWDLKCIIQLCCLMILR